MCQHFFEINILKYLSNSLSFKMGKSKIETEWSQTAKGTTDSAVTSIGEGRSIRNAADLCTVPVLLFAEDVCLWLCFHSPVAGFSLLVFEVS
jgi:hypothetical protein